ncbi:APC membrane recruitment protein 1 [Periophthalmus magnuspinnatus]|uniref:APC membrane recruitment protein 1 n=1 Tax=Periophthalmus magnuspinnatus TaxID=409849 RepID=UPI00145BA5BE|nr:APC membrane recruitment protein 1 [Periophthalmus magnuspinnatus]
MAMASSITDENLSYAKESPSDHLPCCPTDEITEELQASESNTTVKAQKSGKFRRTALTFFGVRKTICILPSFFVGRSKNLSKWSSKKAIFKSKTHDGLSKVCHDDNHRSGYASAGDFVYDSHRDVAGDLHSCCHSKLSPSSGDQKSLSLPRHKRGLRGLFQSIKQHRNNRNGIDKGEMFATRSETQVPNVQSYTEQHLTECLGSEPDVPDFDNTIGPQCTDAENLECVLLENSPKSEFVHELNDNQIDDINLVALVSSDYEELARVQSDPCLKLEMVPEPMLKLEATAGSCEQLNVMFEDVASLKSFDSLTGCGDIIADQEDDSITESTVSGERSRNGGKRASCYLTYQGGGEDMACPEDLGEECPDNMWINDASEEMCCACNQDLMDLSTELTVSHNRDLMNSNSAQQGADSSTADVLTPQSEHQESVPNSDEGYYDSTTPGPEEGQEKAERLQPDRLPRDSYSGDALYELFAPDESLISPHYEKKSQLSGSDESEYLNKAVDFTDTAFLPDINDLKISDALYEANSFLEMSCTKPSELTQNPIGLHEVGLNKQSNLNSKPQAFVNKNMKTSASAGKSSDAEYVKRHSAISFGSTSDPDFETFCEPKEQLLEENKPVALPYRNIKSQFTEVSDGVDNEQTVCFSQALEDFTKRTQMMSKLHNRMDGLETSPAFIPNMEALPAIVTFDVVDMHNEGEYDEQIQMDMEEELSSPYQEFEESYLQKDAFAECDYQMLDLYEQNLLSNTWAIASLPRHLGLTKVRQFLPAPLSQDRRSRSLDTEDLDLNMPDKCKDHRGALPSCFLMERERGSSSHKSLHVPLKDGSITSPWQTKSEMALSLCTSALTIPVCKSLNQTQLDTKTSVTPNTDSTKSLRLYSSTSNSASSELFSSPELYNRRCHLALQTDSCLPRTPVYYTEMLEDGSLLNDQEEHLFDKAAVDALSYNPSMKAKALEGTTRGGISQHFLNSALSIDHTKFE